MRKSGFFLLLVVLLSGLLLTPSLLAQEEATAEPTPEAVATISALVDAARQHADAAAESAEISGQRLDRAFDLLGLFEAFGFIVTVIAGGVGVFGFSRLFSAQNELTKARERIETEQAELRNRLEKQIEEKEAELNAFRTSMAETFKASFDEQHETTRRALLSQSLLPLGERQYRARDLAGALSTYHRALELNPNNPVTHYRLGYVYVQDGDLENAKKYFESSLELERDFAPAMAGLGFVYRKSAENLEKGVKRDRMMNEAENLMLRALELSPRLVDDDGESWWGALGGLYRRRDQIDMAINAYEKASDVTPHSSYGPGNLALLYMKTHNREKMLKTYEKVERLAWAEAQSEKSNYWGYSDVVVARLALGRGDEALEVLDTTLELAVAEYQLDMLIDTLSRLKDSVEPEKQPSILKTIRYINEFRSSRFEADAAQETQMAGTGE